MKRHEGDYDKWWQNLNIWINCAFQVQNIYSFFSLFISQVLALKTIVMSSLSRELRAALMLWGTPQCDCVWSMCATAPILITEVWRSWIKPFSSRISSTTIFNDSNYALIVGMMPGVEEMLACYLTPEAASSFKPPILPIRPCRTSSLVGKAYMAGGSVLMHTCTLYSRHTRLTCFGTWITVKGTTQRS